MKEHKIKLTIQTYRLVKIENDSSKRYILKTLYIFVATPFKNP